MDYFDLGISSQLNPLWFYMETTSTSRHKVSTSCSYQDEKGRSLCHCYCEVVLRKARQAKGGEERRLIGASGPMWLVALVYQPFLTVTSQVLCLTHTQKCTCAKRLTRIWHREDARDNR